jgi:urea transport system substrate-binding protein
MSASLSVDLDWLPRFTSNWTHQGRSAPEAAQRSCRFRPKPRTTVYLLSNLRNPAPAANPTNGAIAFTAGGSHRRPLLHASVVALAVRAAPRCSRQFEPKGEPKSTARIRWLSAAAAILAIFGSGPNSARAEDTIKIGILHSLSGTMAISETILKDLMLMEVADVNAKGGLLGKQIEPVVVDPASNWPLFAEKARELLVKDKVAAVFGCWTSVSRKSVLPVFEELNGLLFYPLEYEGEEASYNIFYGSSVPDNKAVPAVEYLMSKEGGEAKRFVLEGTDYVYPRTSNKIIRAFLQTKGVKDEDIMENYTPFGFSDWQTEVAAIKKFGSSGKKTAVISTINGDANVPFYKELGNQGVKATDIPVIAFSVGEEELAGVDTKPLVGHLAAWSYFQSVNTPENKAFIAKWRAYTKNPKRVTNDPMESAYILFHMWVQAVQQAGTTDVEAVRQAMIGQKVKRRRASKS